MTRRGEYGYYAPYVLAIFGCLSIVSAVLAAIAWRGGPHRPVAPATFYLTFFVANFSSFLHTTRRGKFLEWILDRLRLRGDERVLDMGCGRGAVLTAVARRLTTGRAIGLDTWSTRDQSGKARAVTVRNASLEGVSERIDVGTGDMRNVPYSDAAFDLVVSSLAIHNIRSRSDRRRAVAEAYRVLRPGGRVVIADIRTTSLYAETLRTLGASNLERRRLGWRFWWGNPFAATSLVTASKPPA